MNQVAEQGIAEQMRVVDQVCTEAYPLFEEAESLRLDAETKVANSRKNKKVYRVLSILAILTVVQFISSALVALLGTIGGFLSIPLMILAGVVLYTRLANPYIESYAKRKEAEFTVAIDRAAEAESQGNAILENNSTALMIIPSDYWYPLATNYIYKVIQTGRATTINQALQMFDEQLHRWKVEEANAEIVNQQQAQTNALKGIRRSSAINAAANVANAAANISRWW